MVKSSYKFLKREPWSRKWRQPPFLLRGRVLNRYWQPFLEFWLMKVAKV